MRHRIAVICAPNRVSASVPGWEYMLVILFSSFGCPAASIVDDSRDPCDPTLKSDKVGYACICHVCHKRAPEATRALSGSREGSRFCGVSASLSDQHELDPSMGCCSIRMSVCADPAKLEQISELATQSRNPNRGFGFQPAGFSPESSSVLL